MIHIKRIDEMLSASTLNESYNKNKLFYCIEPDPDNEQIVLRLSEDEDGFYGIGHANTKNMLTELQGIFTDFDMEISDDSGIYTVKEKNNPSYDIDDAYEKVKEIIENAYPGWTEYFDPAYYD